MRCRWGRRKIHQATVEVQHSLIIVLPSVVKSAPFHSEHNTRAGNFPQGQMLISENGLLVQHLFLKKLCFIGIYVRKPLSLDSILRNIQIRPKCKIYNYEFPWSWNGFFFFFNLCAVARISCLSELCYLLEGDSLVQIRCVKTLEFWACLCK